MGLIPCGDEQKVLRNFYRVKSNANYLAHIFAPGAVFYSPRYPQLR